MKRLWDSCGNDRAEIVGCIRIVQGKSQWWALRTNYPSNSMEHSPSESNSSSAAQIFPTFLRNQHVHSLVHSSPPLDPFLGYINRVHSLPPIFFAIRFNIPSTTLSSKWSLSLRFHYQILVCLSPHTCHMPRPSRPQMRDIRSPAIMLCAWMITLLLGKVWDSHSVAGESGLVVCDAVSSGCSLYFKGSGTTRSTFHKIYFQLHCCYKRKMIPVWTFNFQ